MLEGVHALVGEAEEGGGVLGVLGVDGDAEAGGDDGGAAGEEDGASRAHWMASTRWPMARWSASEVGGEEDELVSAEACEGVGGVEGVAEVVGDLAEDLVSGVMAEGVVDFFESVEVEHEEGEWAVGAAGSGRWRG